MIKMDVFLDAFKNDKSESIVKFARIDSAYATGRPRLVFDGEAVPTIKAYPYLSTYSPKANDRVMVVHGVILGAII